MEWLQKLFAVEYLTISRKQKGIKMNTQNLTLSKLVKLTGAKPYQITYLHSLGKLPTQRDSQGAGIPIIWDYDAIQVIKDHINRNK